MVNLGVTIAILLAIAWWVDLGAVGAALIALTPAVLALALALATLDRFVMTYKWRQLVLASDVELDFGTALRIHYQAAVSGRVVPAPLAADVLRAWLTTRARVPEGVAIGTIVLERLVALSVSIVVALLGLAYLARRLPPQVDPAAVFAVLAVGLAVAVGALALVLFVSAKHDRWIGGAAPGPLRRRARQISVALAHFRARRRALVLNGLLGFAEYGVQLGKLLVLASGLGIGLPPLTFVATASVMLLARRVSGTMESWGLGEGSAVLVLVVLGVPADLAVALLLANFAISTVAVLPGAVFFYTHPVHVSPPPTEAARRGEAR